MIDFTQQEKVAKKANKHALSTISKRFKKRITQQERIEKTRYEKLKMLAEYQKITISKLLDEVIDRYLSENMLPTTKPINNKKIIWESISALGKN